MSGGGGGGSGNGNGAAAGRNHHLQSQLPPLRLPNSSESHALELQPILLNTPLALSDAGASGWANGGSSSIHHVSSRLNNATSTSTSTSSAPNDAPPSSSSSSSLLVLPANPAPSSTHVVWRVAARNLLLILTWYFFSTCLSLWNRTLLGHGHGVAGRGAFPAPMFMTAMQFCVQICMARLALWLGVEGGGGGGDAGRSGGGRGRGRALSRVAQPAAGKRRVSGAAAAAAAAALPARRWKRLSDSEQQPELQLAGGGSSSPPPRSASPNNEPFSSSSPTHSGGGEGEGGEPGSGGGNKLSWKAYFTQVVPNGVCTGLDIGLSNFSLSLISLSFYTMCKSTTPLFLLAFAFAWGLEKPSWSLAGVVAVISSGLMLLVYGEAHFDGVGFALVMTASALSGLRWTITQVLLQGGGKVKSGSSGKGASHKPSPSSGAHRPPSPPRSPAAAEAGMTSGGGGSGGGGGHGGGQGPVAVVAALMPVMAVTVALVSLLAERLWVVLPHSPYFDSLNSIALTLGLVAGGATIAFAMVWVEFAVIKLTSALTFMVAGTFKEIVTVLAAVAFLGESFSSVNAAGLAVLVAGVALFNWTKWRKVAAEQREAAAAAAAVEAAAAEARASAAAASQNPASAAAAAASVYETFVPSTAANGSGGSGDLQGVVVERGGAAAAAAARKRRGGGGLGGSAGDGGASLDFEVPLSSSSTSTPTTTATEAERSGAATAPPASGGPGGGGGGGGGSPLRPRAAGAGSEK